MGSTSWEVMHITEEKMVELVQKYINVSNLFNGHIRVSYDKCDMMNGYMGDRESLQL
jgi:hypothetical protein